MWRPGRDDQGDRMYLYTIDGHVRGIATIDKRLSFADQGKQTSVSGFCLEQTNES
jgi:hypothetical protein